MYVIIGLSGFRNDIFSTRNRALDVKMTQNEITELNLGSSLDAIANIDPRG